MGIPRPRIHRTRRLLVAALFVLLPPPDPVGGQEPERGGEPRDWSLLPFALYSPETSLGFGVLFARVREDDGGRFLGSTLLNGLYTLKNQASVGWGYEIRPGTRWMVLSSGSGKLSWPDRFYPPGNRAGREAYEDWTSRGLTFRLQTLRRAGHRNLFLGPLLAVYHVEILETEENGILARKGVSGSEDHGLVGSGLAGIWDSRDSQVYPRGGTFHSFSVMGLKAFRGPDRSVGRVEIDLRSYHTVRGSSVLALRGHLTSSWGDVPFTLHSGIGGQGGGLRGVYENRYSHRTASVAQAEFRFPLTGRLGGVVFGGFGEVSPDLGLLRLKGIHGTVGTGLRFTLMPDSGLNLGVDFGMGEGESGVYFLLGEAF